MSSFSSGACGAGDAHPFVYGGRGGGPCPRRFPGKNICRGWFLTEDISRQEYFLLRIFVVADFWRISRTSCSTSLTVSATRKQDSQCMSPRRKSRRKRWLEERRSSLLYLALLKLAQIPRLENNKYQEILKLILESLLGEILRRMLLEGV